MRSHWVLKILLPVALLAALPVSAGEVPPAPKKGWSFKDAALIPVQSGGRIKPLDSFARELMLFLTGSRFYGGWEPVDLSLSWMTEPAKWESVQFIQVTREDVRKQLGLESKRSRFSPEELIKDSHLKQYADEVMSRPPAQGMKQDPREQELRSVLDRIGAFRRIVSGEAWPIVPAAGAQGWKPLSAEEADLKGEGAEIRRRFAEMALAFRSGEQAGFESGAVRAREAVEAAMPDRSPHILSTIRAEYLYNHIHPFLLSWVLYLAGALAWMFYLGIRQGDRFKWLQKTAFGLVSGSALIHIAGIATRCYVAGRPPVSNMYESILWVSLGVTFFAFAMYWKNKQPVLLISSSLLSALLLVAADAAPAMMDPGIHPLVPVLRSNFWLTIHVLNITLSYAAFALSLGLGNVALFQFARGGAGHAARVQNLNQLSYRVMQFGVVLLAGGTILGGVWADYSWGRFWGWDPKEVWALIALLGYLAVLHARYTGWIGQYGFAAWSVISFVLVVMAWYGVNFVLGVGLHSYGFSTGGRGFVAALVGSQLLYVGATYLAKVRRSSRTDAESKSAVQSAAG